jgi:hypothetical protein
MEKYILHFNPQFPSIGSKHEQINHHSVADHCYRLESVCFSSQKLRFRLQRHLETPPHPRKFTIKKWPRRLDLFKPWKSFGVGLASSSSYSWSMW